MSQKLTVKQQAFVDYYVETGNATEAAIRAGYSKKSARAVGSENLSKPYIKEYIDIRLQEIESARIAKAEEVLKYLTSVMRGEVKEQAVVVVNLGDYCSDAKIVDKQVDIKDRNKAAEMLAKRYGILTETIQFKDVPKIVDDIGG